MSLGKLLFVIPYLKNRVFLVGSTLFKDAIVYTVND